MAEAPSPKEIAAGKDLDKNISRARDLGITYGAAARELGITERLMGLRVKTHNIEPRSYKS